MRFCPRRGGGRPNLSAGLLLRPDRKLLRRRSVALRWRPCKSSFRSLLEPREAAVPSSFRLAPALDSRGVVAPDVSLYWGLLEGELPFRGNLSEGSVLFVE